jgi:hypothetical protein
MLKSDKTYYVALQNGVGGSAGSADKEVTNSNYVALRNGIGGSAGKEKVLSIRNHKNKDAPYVSIGGIVREIKENKQSKQIKENKVNKKVIDKVNKKVIDTENVNGRIKRECKRLAVAKIVNKGRRSMWKNKQAFKLWTDREDKYTKCRDKLASLSRQTGEWYSYKCCYVSGHAEDDIVKKHIHGRKHYIAERRLIKKCHRSEIDKRTSFKRNTVKENTFEDASENCGCTCDNLFPLRY